MQYSYEHLSKLFYKLLIRRGYRFYILPEKLTSYMLVSTLATREKVSPENLSCADAAVNLHLKVWPREVVTSGRVLTLWVIPEGFVIKKSRRRADRRRAGTNT